MSDVTILNVWPEGDVVRKADYDALKARLEEALEVLRNTSRIPPHCPSYPCWCDPESSRDAPHGPQCGKARAVLKERP